LRLVFGLVGLQVLISALWGGWEGMLTRQFAAMDPASRETFERAAGGDLPTFISHCANAFGFLQPILLTLFTSLSVFALGWFRPQLSWPSRLNIAMGALTAGTVVGLLLLPTMALPNMFAWAWISPAIVVLAYFVTTLRGARRDCGCRKWCMDQVDRLHDHADAARPAFRIGACADLRVLCSHKHASGDVI